jgi:hypothetical protein
MLCVERRKSKFDDVLERNIEYLYNEQLKVWKKQLTYIENNGTPRNRKRLNTICLGEISFKQ